VWTVVRILGTEYVCSWGEFARSPNESVSRPDVYTLSS